MVDIGDGKTVVVAGQKDGRVFALDWETGQNKLWEGKLGRGSIQGGVHFGMAADGTTVYVPINDMNDTRNGEWLDPELARPGVSAVNAVTGEVLWSIVSLSHTTMSPFRHSCAYTCLLYTSPSPRD